MKLPAPPPWIKSWEIVSQRYHRGGITVTVEFEVNHEWISKMTVAGWDAVTAAANPKPDPFDGGWVCIDTIPTTTVPKLDPLDIMAAAPERRRPGLPLNPTWDDEKTDPGLGPPLGSGLPGTSDWARTRSTPRFKIVRINTRHKAALVERLSTGERRWLRDDGSAGTDISVRFYDADYRWKPSED